MKVAVVRSMLSYFSRLWEGMLSLLYPPLCLSCGAALETGIICSNCEDKLSLWPTQAPLRGRIPSRAGILLLPPLYAYEKEGLVAQLIHDFKYRGQRCIGHALAQRYATHLAQCKAATSYEVLLPVPMHWWRLSRRGFNQSALIARVLSKHLDIPLERYVLLRSRYTRKQVGMNSTERWKNMQNKFALRHALRIQNKRVLLIDDVLTTGATTLACAELLMENKAQSVGICVLALRK